MAPLSTKELLLRLLDTTSPSEVAKVLTEIGDYPEVGIDQEFGPFGLRWHPFGANASNISSINLGTKPGRSLTERITNADDAILEERAQFGIPNPRSARAAAQQWFGRPPSGPEDGLFNWDFASGGHDRRVAVVLNASGIETAPTVDVVDDGIGLTPDQFPSTILSLQSGNKIQKWYLIGAFGQGGASALAFCEYALILSRAKAAPGIVGFTLIKILQLSEQYKEDTYAYLSLQVDGRVTVPWCDCPEETLSLYKPEQGVWLPTLHKGTIVRHYGYKLPGLDGNLSPTPGNLYHYLHLSMFDPVLPFRVIDLRAGDKARNRGELVTGSRNRLMRLVKAASTEGDDEVQKRSTIKHYRQMEYVVPPGSSTPSIGIEYWVVFNFRKPSGGKAEDLILRPHSNELFVQKGHPIVGTLNGQNQGELTSQILRELGLGMVARHIVIHIDATEADRRIRRELFATTREGFKDGTVLTEITNVLRKMLEEDSTLATIEKELAEKLAHREAQTTSDEVRKQVTRLLLDAGLQVTETGIAEVAGGYGETQKTLKERTRKIPTTPSPLPTLPFPQVTKFAIATPQPTMRINENDIEFVLVETDADAEFDRRNLVMIRSEPPLLELVSKRPLRGGRIRWRFRPGANAKVGDTGRLVATITRPDGTQIADAVGFDVLAAPEEKVKKTKGLVPPFEIIGIDPVEDAEAWSAVWPDVAEGARDDEQAAVAYKPVRVAGAINVYYSKIFSPYRELYNKLLLDRSALAEIFKSNYEVWIGYHAILQENSRSSDTTDIDQDALDKLLESDRVRVAQMQVRQAFRAAELMQKLMQMQARE